MLRAGERSHGTYPPVNRHHYSTKPLGCFHQRLNNSRYKPTHVFTEGQGRPRTAFSMAPGCQVPSDHEQNGWMNCSTFTQWNILTQLSGLSPFVRISSLSAPFWRPLPHHSSLPSPPTPSSSPYSHKAAPWDFRGTACPKSTNFFLWALLPLTSP